MFGGGGGAVGFFTENSRRGVFQERGGGEGLGGVYGEV